MIKQFIKLSMFPAMVSMLSVSAFVAAIFSAGTERHGILELFGSLLTLFLGILLVAAPVMIVLGLPLIGLLWAKYRSCFERVSLLGGSACGAALGFAIHYCLLLSWGGWSDPILVMPVGLIGGIYAAVFTFLFIRRVQRNKMRT